MRSAPGQGSTFEIYFPRVSEESDEISGAISSELPRGTETILLVEDEEMVRSFARRVLRRQGYTVLAAADGGNAYFSCVQHRGSIDLLLTDVVMPTMNGRELYQRLSALRPDLKVLYMSGHTENVIARHGVLEEGAAFIQKPFSIQMLAQRVREALDAEPDKLRGR